MQELELLRNDAAELLRERGYETRLGWSALLAEQLVGASQEDTIKHWTPRDHRERFASVEAANDWYASRPRYFYSLAEGDELAGVIWYGNDPRPELSADWAFAIRLYEIARGKRLAGGFMQATELDLTERTKPQGIWLETDTVNDVARRLYEGQGYETVSQSSDRIIMRKDP